MAATKKNANEAFRTTLNTEVDRYADELSLAPHHAFLIFCATHVFDLEDDEAFDALTDGPSDIGLDMGLIDRPNNRVILAQGKYTESAIQRADISQFRTLPATLKDSKRLRQLKPNEEVQAFARRFRTALKNDFTVEQYFFHAGSISQALRREFDDTIRYFGINELADEYYQRLRQDQPPDQITLTSPPTEWFELPNSPDGTRCFIAEIPLRELHAIFQRHRHGLFHDNIRLHAGKDKEANQAMRETILGTDGHNFLYYNNGISILCQQIKKLRAKQTRAETGLKLIKPQIINGAQTTYTIGNLDEEQIPLKASVLARIVCPPRNKSQDFRERVIRFNNTQTPVRTRDFRANDEIQKKLATTMSRYKTAYFLQRKRGEWQTLQRFEQAKYRRHGKGTHLGDFRHIDNEKLAQCKLAWDQKPAIAKNRKQDIFRLVAGGGLYEQAFPDDCFSQENVAEYIFIFELNRFFQDRKLEWNKQHRQAQTDTDDPKRRDLERTRFLNHSNFFMLAATEHLLRSHSTLKRIADIQEQFRIDEDTIRPFFDRLVAHFSRVIDLAAEAKDGFVINNWFKNDENYARFIRKPIDDEPDYFLEKLPRPS